jgi:DNA-binding GntR family transcriptional regulator
MQVVLDASSLTDSVSDALRKEIIRGAIPPGVKLTEAWISERFSVARPTAKASLDRLTAEGLLRRGPRRSSTVPKLSADDINDIYYSRGPVESTAVRTLAKRGNVPADAERALMLMRLAAETDDHAAHTEADVNFHRALVAAVASPRLQRMHHTVMGEAQLCIAQVRRATSVDLDALTESHAAILVALRAKNEDGAASALLADLESCRLTLLNDV